MIKIRSIRFFCFFCVWNVGQTRADNSHDSAEVNGRDVKVMDTDNDGYRDIIATVDGKSATSNKVGFLLLLRNIGKGNFETIVLAKDLNGKALLGVGDFDQDGLQDISVLGIDDRRLDVYYHHGQS